MGHFHWFYVLVPEENMTMGRFARVVASLGEMPSANVGPFEVEDPDAPLEGLDYTAIIQGLEFGFGASAQPSIDDSEEREIDWPIPDGTALVHAMIWDKHFPYGDEGNAAIGAEVMRRTFTGMGGIYANVASELGYGEVLTFDAFVHMHEGYVLLSRELADLVGRDRLAQVALVRDFEGSVEVVTDDAFGPKEQIPSVDDGSAGNVDALLDELLERAEVLHCDTERLMPDFDEAQIGLVREPKVSSYWKPKTTQELPPPGGDALAAWALAVAEQGIKTGDKYTLGKLNSKLEELQKVKDLVGQRDVLRQMVRVSWAQDRGLGFRNMNNATRLADVLVKLGEYKEAEMLYRMVLKLHTENNREPNYIILQRYAEVLRTLGRSDEAEGLFHRAIAISNPENDFRDFPAGLMLSEVAMINLERGDIARAEEALAQAKPIAAYSMEANPENMSKYMGVRALVEQAKGDLGRAEDLARRGVDYAWSTEYADKDDVLYNLSVLEKVLQAKGDADGLAAVQTERVGLEAAVDKGDYIHRVLGAGGHQ